MTITINGCPKEVAALVQMLASNTKSKRNPYFTPVLTEPINKPFRGKNPGNRGYEEITGQNRHTYKEKAPQTEAAERQENKALSREEAKEVVKGIDTAVREALKYQCHTP